MKEIHPLLKSKGHRPRKGSVLLCKYCNKEFYNGRKDRLRKYCSPKCTGLDQKKTINKICKVCNKKFTTIPSAIKYRNVQYCSKLCAGKAQTTKVVGVTKGNKVRKGLLAKCQRTINRYIRLRDCKGNGGTNCISCNVWYEFSKLDAGHFIPITSSAVRFDEKNINAQCIKCNRYLHGNIRHYQKAMIVKYGKDVIQELESKEFVPYKWTVEELEQLHEKYYHLIKELECN